jgi:hypothetical protein
MTAPRDLTSVPPGRISRPALAPWHAPAEARHAPRRSPRRALRTRPRAHWRKSLDRRAIVLRSHHHAARPLAFSPSRLVARPSRSLALPRAPRAISERTPARGKDMPAQTVQRSCPPHTRSWADRGKDGRGPPSRGSSMLHRGPSRHICVAFPSLVHYTCGSRVPAIRQRASTRHKKCSRFPRGSLRISRSTPRVFDRVGGALRPRGCRTQERPIRKSAARPGARDDACARASWVLPGRALYMLSGPGPLPPRCRIDCAHLLGPSGPRSSARTNITEPWIDVGALLSAARAIRPPHRILRSR